MSGRGEPDDIDYVEPSGGDRPSGLTPVQSPALQSDEDPGFDVIEVDDRDQDVGRQQDTRLTQDDQGDQPLIRQQPDQQDGRQQRQPQSRRERRQAGKDSRATDERERQRLAADLAASNARIENLESVIAGVQPRLVELGEENIKSKLAGVDQQIAEANNSYQDANRRIATCLQNADYDGFAAAQEVRDKALVQRERLSNTKAAIEIGLKRAQDQGGGQGGDMRLQPNQDGRGFDIRRQPPEPQGPRLSPRAQEYVQQFKDDHPWYGTRGNELDTQILAAIDQDVHNRGFKPDTQEYWDEVSDMARERLPNRFRDGGRSDDRMTDDAPPRQQQRQPSQQQQRRGPPVAGPADRAPPAANGRQAVRINPERKQAMIDTGSIDSSGRVVDATKYKNQLKKYAEYDRNNPRS